MKKRVCFALIFFLWVGCASAQTRPEKERLQHTPLIVGYLAESRLSPSRNSIKAIEQGGAARRLTHIIYAFANIVDGRPLLSNEDAAYRQAYSASESIDGKADNSAENKALRGAFNQLRKLKARYPRLKVLISIGGASAINAKGFSLVSRTEESRQRFVAACVDLLITGNLPQGVSAARLFDGIDVDWEYPVECAGCVAEDKSNFTLLLEEFRRQLDEQGKKGRVHYALTIASSPWVDDYSKYEWQKVHPLLDFINLMTYDLAPPGKTRPHSPLYKSSAETGRWSATFNTHFAVTHYLEEGVPANKIVMGVPFYGRGWEGVPDVNRGLYQKPVRWAHGSWGEGRESYRELKKLRGFQLFRDAETQALWIFNPTAGVFWSYDDPSSLLVKMAYVKRTGLGGVTFWELSGDDEDSSLVKAIYRGLHE